MHFLLLYLLKKYKTSKNILLIKFFFHSNFNFICSLSLILALFIQIIKLDILILKEEESNFLLLLLDKKRRIGLFTKRINKNKKRCFFNYEC